MLAGALISAAPGIAQGMGHTWIMRGQIVALDKGSAVLCVGKADGARPAQILDVYRMTYRPGSPKSTAATYRRDRVGSVVIDEIVNEHFARAHVAEGVLAKNDIVELRHPPK